MTVVARRRYALVGLLALLLLGCGSDPPAASRQAAHLQSDGPSVRFTNGDLRRLLLPRSAVPRNLPEVRESILPNELLAEYAADPRGALAELRRSGRVAGASVDYRLAPAAAPSDAPAFISSEATVYESEAAAQWVLSPAGIAGVLTVLGLPAVEVRMGPVGEESRAFRVTRPDDHSALVVYLVVFRRRNVVQSVTAGLPVAVDDAGRMVERLARRQVLMTPLPDEITRPR